MNARLRIMLDSREIEEAEAPDREVAARWERAVKTFMDAGKDLSAGSALTLFYQAGLQAATTLVRAADLRVLGGDHHRHTFEALHALDLGELSATGRTLNAFRRSRHQSVYDWDDAPAPDAGTQAAEIRTLSDTVRRMLELGGAWLVSIRPGLVLDQPR